MEELEQVFKFVATPRCAFCTHSEEGHCMIKNKTTYRNPKRKPMKKRMKCVGKYMADETKVVEYFSMREKPKSIKRPPWFWMKGKQQRMVRDMILRELERNNALQLTIDEPDKKDQ